MGRRELNRERRKCKLADRVSHVVLGDVAVVVLANSARLHLVVEGVHVRGRCLALEVCTVPRGEFVLAGLTKRTVDVTLGVVGPDLADVEILNERDGVATPELLRWDQTTRRHYAARGELGTLLDASTLKNNTLVANEYIIFNVARVERATSSNGDIVADLDRGRHAGGQGCCSVDHAVVANRAKRADTETETTT